MSKNTKILIAVLVVAAVAVGGYVLTKDKPFEEADAFEMMKNYYKESMNVKAIDQDLKMAVSIDSQDPNIGSFQDRFHEVYILTSFSYYNTFHSFIIFSFC